MGYSTDYTGVLLFNQIITGPMLARLGKILGEDMREHPEVKVVGDFCHLDLEVVCDYSGLKWNGAEKSYAMDDQIKTVINHMQEEYPDFMVYGTLACQGEEASDRYDLSVEGGEITRQEYTVTPTQGECPHCGETL